MHICLVSCTIGLLHLVTLVCSAQSRYVVKINCVNIVAQNPRMRSMVKGEVCI